MNGKLSFTALFLLILFTFQIAGNYIGIGWQLLELREKLTSVDPSVVSALPLVSIEARKTETNQHEISRDGKMYDVLFRAFENGRLVLHCVADTKEDELIALMVAVHHSNTDAPGGENTRSLSKAEFLKADEAEGSAREKTTAAYSPFKAAFPEEVPAQAPAPPPEA